MASKLRYRLQILAGAATIAALNLYVARNGFHAVSTAHMNSMHGFWIGIARLAGSRWLHPGWWPYVDCGTPFEYLYAPLMPFASAAWARLGHVPVSQGFGCVTTLLYVLGPVALFLLAVDLTRAPGASLAAGLLYSLASPSAWLAPYESAVHWADVIDARRLYLISVWDDGPHVLGLTLSLVALLFLARSFQRRAWYYPLLAIAASSLAVFATAFGPVLLAMGVVALLLAFRQQDGRRNLAISAGVGLATYLIVCPFFSPSLLRIVRRTAEESGEPWNRDSLLAIGLVIALTIILQVAVYRLRASWQTRFFAQYALLMSSVGLLFRWLHWYFVPQGGRYRSEIDLSVALLLVFAVRPLWNRMPRWAMALSLIVLLGIGARATILHRRFAKEVLKAEDVRPTVEYRVNRWIEENLPGQRVMSPGSIAMWQNAFTRNQQFSGGSWPTKMNRNVGIGETFLLFDVPAKERAAEVSLLWLKAFGVQAITIVGKDSQEFWRAYSTPGKFEGVLTPLWHETGTTIYRVPQRTASFAHIVPEPALVRDPPVHGLDVAQIRTYVGALDDETLPLASWRWLTDSAARVEATTAPGQAVSIQVSYHPGWGATVDGAPVELHSDGLGLMWLRPPGPGSHRIELEYTGGAELRICRAVSLATIVALFGFALWQSTRRSGSGAPRRR